MPNPPKLFLKFFRWFCHPSLHKPIEGDLMELYDERVKEQLKIKADLRFILDVLLLLRPSIIKPANGTYRLTNYGMLKNYLKVSLRSILRNKTYASLNILGLSLGIACSILIFIYVKNELSYDTYNSQYDQTYRVLHHFGSRGDQQLGEQIPINEYQVWGSAPVGPALQSYFPEIKSTFQFTSPNPWLIEYKGKLLQEDNIVFADSAALDVFDWPLLAGSKDDLLTRPNTIVLEKGLATKIFGDLNPVGESLKMENRQTYEVTGVVEIPSNSHFTFDGMISMSTFRNMRPNIFESWGYVDFYTYFTVHKGASINSLASKTTDFLKENEIYETGYAMAFEPLADAYLHSDAGRQPGPVGSMTNITIFLAVAIFVLAIACINFMNLSTARSVERAKEVAIRKTIGSRRKALITQFLFEAIILTFIAFAIASVLILLAHPMLEELSGKSLSIAWLYNYRMIGLALLLVLAIGSIAGIYPAFVLSNFKPVKVLKGSFKSSKEGVALRRVLVVLQFTLSITLLVGATVVFSQMEHLKKYDMGFNPDQILVIDYGWDGDVQNKLKYIKSEFVKHKDVVQVAASRATPGDFFPNAGTNIQGPSNEMLLKGPAIYEIDEDFVPTYEMNILAGRNFSAKFPSDSSSALLVNEAAARLYGYANPEEIVGKSFSQWGREGKVIGVVEDFNYVSLHKEVESLSLRYSTSVTTTKLSLKLNSSNYGRTLDELEEIWARVAPHRPFVSHFNNDNFNKQYEADDRFGMIFTIFSGFAIFVACLGLLGLTIYSTAQRAKEIGIRKVLGASTRNIIKILSKDFIQLYTVSLLVAIPTSWYFMNSWLDGFAYRIGIGWELFLISASVTLIVSFITMSLKTVSAALSNPVEALRNE